MRMKELFIAFYGLAAKEWVRFFRIWTQSFLPSAVTTTLYFMIFGNVIGHRIGSMMGVSYMAYIMPGLVMLAVINNSYANVSSSFYMQRFNRSIEELLVSPMPSWLIVLGFLSGGLGRGFLVGLVVFVIGILFSGVHVQHIGFMLFVMILCSLLFSLTGFLNGVFASGFDSLLIIPTFILTPLTYLGGVFYDIKALPVFWRHVSSFNPIYYIINLFRYATLGISSTNIAMSLIIVLTIVVTLFLLVWYLLVKGVRVKS